MNRLRYLHKYYFSVLIIMYVELGLDINVLNTTIVLEDENFQKICQKHWIKNTQLGCL